MSSPDLSYPLAIMADEQKALEAQLAAMKNPGAFGEATKARLAGCQLATQILLMHEAFPDPRQEPVAA